MLLSLWVATTGFGFATFLLGHLLGFHEVASIGAVFIIILGGDVILNDIQVKTGEEIDREYTTVDNQTVENATMVNDTYRTHSWTEQFDSANAISIGLFQALVGVFLFYQQMLAIGEGQ